MNTNFPLKKTFEQDFITINGKNLFTLKYEQATIKEYYEYLNYSPQEQARELLNILRKCIKYSLKDKIMLFLNKDYVTDFEKNLNIEEVFGSIFANRFRIHKSIFEWKRQKGKKWWSKGSIDSVWLSAICKEYNISPTDLMENYTLEQYFWFLDWIEWSNNTMTKEWQATNDLALIDKEAVKSRADETRARFAKFKKI